MGSRYIALAFAFVMGIPAASHARSPYASQIPNGTCNTCHFVPGGPRNVFGQQAGQNRRNGRVLWSALYRLDSDGDGYTNGEELGDPAGLFPGQPAAPALSDPGDAFSTPAPVGSPPVVEAADFSMDEDDVLEARLQATDPDGDTLLFRLVDEPSQGDFVFTDRSTGSFSYTPPPEFSGEVTFRFAVFDGSNVAPSAAVSIVVREINDPPSLDVETSHRVQEGRSMSFRVSAADPEDGDLVPMVSTALPEGAMWEEERGRFSWEPGPEQAGAFEVGFFAEDSAGVRAEATVDIEVVETNFAPEMGEISGPETGLEGERLQFIVEATDRDMDPLQITWDFQDGSAVQSDTGLTEVEHVFAQDGRKSIRVTVSDGVDEVQRRLSLEIENVAPDVSAGDDQDALVGETVEFTGEFSDPGAEDEHVVRWDFGDGSALVSGTLTPTHVFETAGEFLVILSVGDGQAVVEDLVKVTVMAPQGENNGGDAGRDGGGDRPDAGMPQEDGCVAGSEGVCLCESGAVGNRRCSSQGVWEACLCGTSTAPAGDSGCQSAVVPGRWLWWSRR